MKWGDYILETDVITPMILHVNGELLLEQMVESFPILEGFDKTKPCKMGWYIEQEETV